MVFTTLFGARHAAAGHSKKPLHGSLHSSITLNRNPDDALPAGVIPTEKAGCTSHGQVQAAFPFFNVKRKIFC